MFSSKTRLGFLSFIVHSLILEIIIQPKANFKSIIFRRIFACIRLDKFRKQPACPFQPCAIMIKKVSFLTWREKATSENSAIRNWKKSRSSNALKDQGLKSKIFVNFSSGFPKAATPMKSGANFSLIKKSHSTRNRIT